jgi:hypothetical protein
MDTSISATTWQDALARQTDARMALSQIDSPSALSTASGLSAATRLQTLCRHGRFGGF